MGSIDALRGLTVAAMLLVNNPGDWGHVYAPLLHADWHGFTPTDLIFPLFLFIAGVSMAFSLSPRAGEPALRPALRSGLLQRALRIAVAGAVLHLLAWWLMDLPAYRLWGVLQRIALCVAVVGLLAIQTRARSPARCWGCVRARGCGWGRWVGWRRWQLHACSWAAWPRCGCPSTSSCGPPVSCCGRAGCRWRPCCWPTCWWIAGVRRRWADALASTPLPPTSARQRWRCC
jgi:hypothetical protein